MAGKLTTRSAESLAKTRGRYLDGHGLFLRVLDPGRRVYWVYRFTTDGREREKSVGSYPAMSLAQARIKHAELRAQVLAGTDVIAKRNVKAAAPSGTPTFGEMADRYIATHEGGWKNSKHHQQWVMTLTKYCAPIRDLPVDQIDAKAVLQVLEPKWRDAPETMSRLRGRIEVIWRRRRSPVISTRTNRTPQGGAAGSIICCQRRRRSARVATTRRWITAICPTFMAKLGQTVGNSSRALAFTVLTCARTGEALGATWDEIDLETATWRVPKERMKMGKAHDVPLSDQAVAILRAQHATRSQNPHVFPGRPMRGLSNMSMAMLMRRLGAGDYTVHGMRSAARSWMADQGVAFELAEAALGHQVGNAVVQAYQRSSMLERRRPVLAAWSDYVTGKTDGNVVPIKRGAA